MAASAPYLYKHMILHFVLAVVEAGEYVRGKGDVGRYAQLNV